MDMNYAQYAIEKAVEILAIDSPTGYTDGAARWAQKQFEALGYNTKRLAKGGVMVDLGGENVRDALLLTAHLDTLGAMIAEIKSNGRLRLVPLGSMHADSAEGENVRVYTRSGAVFEGTFRPCDPSYHVNKALADTKRSFETMEVTLDEDVSTTQDVRGLGLDVGDIVCFEPRTRVTASGYIKSRFLDNKLEVGVVLAYAKYLSDRGETPPRRVYVHLPVYEEVGHGAAGPVPQGVTEILSLDMGCVGEGVQCTEKQVSICVRDSDGPYNYELVTRLVNAAICEGADYALDVYPNYSSDAGAAVLAGADVRHGLIGAGIFASHGYERSHINGVLSTLKLLNGFILGERKTL